ncbi:MAG: IMP dehydrogenase, partial [Rhodoglobus sp.]|nr:IMP dehydrogenase [Rhodoglobus sp.]
MRFYETTPQHDLTYSDVFLVPERSAVSSRLSVSLAPGDGTGATIPIVSANMNSVTGARLAATLARRGGLGVLPQDLHPDELEAAIRAVKEQPVEFDAAVILAPGDTVAAALALLPPAVGHAIVIQDEDGTYLGAVAAEDLGTAMAHAPLGDLLGRPVVTLDATELQGPR